jgi:HK97 family phage portal protein
MTGVDSQHLETRKHQIEEICRHMRVIPLMVQHSDKTATYASAEQMFIAHVVHTIAPWATRFEQSAEANLLAPGEDVDIRFNLKSLMRGAAKDRAEYYAKALGSGGSPAWMTQNEVREDDGLDAIEGADALPQPANMTTPASVESSNAAT